MPFVLHATQNTSCPVLAIAVIKARHQLLMVSGFPAAGKHKWNVYEFLNSPCNYVYNYCLVTQPR